MGYILNDRIKLTKHAERKCNRTKSLAVGQSKTFEIVCNLAPPKRWWSDHQSHCSDSTIRIGDIKSERTTISFCRRLYSTARLLFWCTKFLLVIAAFVCNYSGRLRYIMLLLLLSHAACLVESCLRV